MRRLLLILSIASAVYCYNLANGDALEIHTVLGGAVTVKLEYPDNGLPIPNCCSTAGILLQPMLAGALVTEVADLKDLGYLLRLDFVENIVMCHLVPNVTDTYDLSSSFCPHLTCPVGWNLLQDTCFLVTNASGPWSDGQAYCQSYDGMLATISSSFQQMALSDMLTNDTWIGLKHSRNTNSFAWINGSKHTYASWAQDEFISEISNGKECVEMRQHNDFLWSAAQCDLSKRFLCSVPGMVIPGFRQMNKHSLAQPSTTTHHPTHLTTHFSGCANGWSEYQYSCYKLFTTRRTYIEATNHCRTLGGYLTSIGSEEKQSFVQGLLTTNTYIGLNDLDYDGVFVWQDGSSFNYDRWSPGEPNQSGNEDCVELRPEHDFQWNDVSCNNKNQYVCSVPNISTTSTVPPYATHSMIDLHSDLTTDYPPNLTTDYPPNITTDYPPNLTTDYPPNLTTDYPPNLTTDYPPKLTTDYPPNLTTDYPLNLTTDYPLNLTTDYPPNLTTDYPPNLTTDYPLNLTTDYPPNLTTDYSWCASGWSNYKSFCYKLFTTPRTFSQAAYNCRNIGGNLASIGSEEEQSFVQGLLTTHTYIGLNDFENEGDFVWQDGSPFSYNRWSPGEPNQAGNEDCVELRPEHDFQWNDVSCNNENQYICEIPWRTT